MGPTMSKCFRYSLTSSLASVAPIAGHGWRGGCSARRDGGWHWFCLDRTAYDTATPYFRKSSNTRHTSLRNILLHINYFTINNSCNWQYHYLHVRQRRHHLGTSCMRLPALAELERQSGPAR